jgi:glycosyltransferase involved in cell wall biosynthesis
VRIALVSTPFVPVPPPKYGGTELIVATLARALVRRGHDVVLYATGDSYLPDVEVAYLYEQAVWPPDPGRELNHVAFAARDLAARDDIDVVHAHVPAAMAFAPFLGAPVVYTLHHARDEHLDELYRGCASRRVSFVAISHRQRELLELEAEVVHHGLPPGDYALGRGAGRYAAFIGRFAEEKGVDVAIEVAARAGVKLRLAGQPHWKDEAYFRSRVERRLREPHVRWLGEAGHPEKVRLLGGALATLFPIAWEEPFGLVMIESMLCGTPVISYARGSAPEVIDEGVTGWTVRDEDEMAWRLRRLAAGGRFDRARCRERAARRFSVEVMTDGYLMAYAAALGRPIDADEVALWPAS